MAGGQRGVEKVIEIMKRDFINTMALTGSRNISEIQQAGAKIRSN
jgi:isopentenyl diphosphate isomerase/L-lactate dehydrogenase-like FMN-dependent dehydrogenase